MTFTTPVEVFAAVVDLMDVVFPSWLVFVVTAAVAGFGIRFVPRLWKRSM